MRSNRKVMSLALLGAALTAMFAPAVATTVQPVIVDLTTSGSRTAQTINVENTSSEPLPVEIRIEEIAFDENGARPAGSATDIRVFPLQAVIPPGQSQAFRVQYAGDAALDRGKSYYVTVAQVPIALPQGQSGIQVLYNFQVLVSVAPARVRPNLRVESASIGRDAGGAPAPVITVSNDSAAHGYLSQGSLSLTGRDAQGRVLYRRTLGPSDLQQTVGFGLVAPGQRRTMTLPVSLPAESGTLEARFLPARR